MGQPGEMVVIFWVQDLNLNREFFKALRFQMTDLAKDQFMAQLNGATVVVQAESPERKVVEGPKGRGIEFWFTVPDIKTHYEWARENDIRITVPMGNRGHSQQGDFSTETPDGYQITFY